MDQKAVVLDRFKPRFYQTPIIDAIENKGYKRVLAILPRRAGKDITAWNLCIRQCLSKVCVVYYCLPTYSHARKVIWDSVTNSGERFLDYIPEELIASKNSQELKIRFINGSLLQLVGSDNFDGLVGTNPYGIVFSEYALSDKRAYDYLRPILVANQGWAVFISCVAPDTLVIGVDGLKRIKNVSKSRDTYSDLNQPIYGLGGFHNAEQFYYGGQQKTLKITLASGYEIECTPVHPIWNGSKWVKSQDLKVGDLLPVQYGQNVWGKGLDISGFKHKATFDAFKQDIYNKSLDFLYLLGLIHADGSYNKNSVCVTKKKDQEIIDFLHGWKFKTRLDGIHHELSSRDFCSLLEYMGFKHGARNKAFPEMLFNCTKDQMAAFIQGVFDGDGTSSSNKSKKGRVKLTSTCHEFLKDLQIVLLNFGIASSIISEHKEPTKIVKVSSKIYNLEITSYFAHVFYRDIGFRLQRKQKNWNNISASCAEESGNIYPIDIDKIHANMLPSNIVTNPKRISRRLIKKLSVKRPHPYLQELLRENLFYSPIKEINFCLNEVYDFVIPVTHSFFSNGFLSHNTPRGKNHLYELWQIASNSDDWFAYKMSVDETRHISLADIEKEKEDGLISDDLIQQEYFCSFDLGVEGSYYSKYLDRMRLRGQIGITPWEVGFKVHTSWDLGVRDATSIIFFQVVGQTVRIIDCYENNKHGLEHYINVLHSKPYTYGTHIAPHDIQVKEFGSGMTRLEKARQLGINFTVSSNISIVDGIEAVRTTFSKMWIDEKTCAPLLKAIESYRQEFDNKKKVYKSNPLHDWSSNFADSLRYLCISLPKTRDGLSAEDLEKRYQEAVYGYDQSGTPSIFRDDLPKY